jgi:hypothetical protein
MLPSSAFVGLINQRSQFLAIENPVTVFSYAADGPFAATDSQGNIGAEILEKFKVILDYQNNRAILES